MLDDVGGRKFIFAIVVIILGFALVITNRVGSDLWFNFVEIVGGTYVVGNVVSKVVDKTETKV